MPDAGHTTHVGSQSIFDLAIRVRHAFVLTQVLRP